MPLKENASARATNRKNPSLFLFVKRVEEQRGGDRFNGRKFTKCKNKAMVLFLIFWFASTNIIIVYIVPFS